MAKSSDESVTNEKLLRIIRDRIRTILSHTTEHGFANQQARLLKLGDIEVVGVSFVDGSEEDTQPTRGAKAKVTMEMTVDESCCNFLGNAHGGFIAWLIDLCSSLPLLALSGHDRWHSSGVSTNINVYYLRAAPCGMPIRVVSTVLQQGKTNATIEARVEESATGQLLAWGAHTKQDQPPQTKGKL